MSVFRFKQFNVSQDRCALKLGTDAVLLGSVMTIPEGCRRALDIGTGSGVIALMAAQRCPGARIEAIDIDEGSILDARDNFSLSPWPDRLSATLIRLQDFVPESSFDLIFSNPPFYVNSLTNPDPRLRDARHASSLPHETLLSFASEWLSPSGRLELILPSNCEEPIRRDAAAFGLFPDRIVRIRTTKRKGFKRIIIEFTRIRELISEEELCLNDAGPLTSPFLLDRD